jgi:hypothetical protein
MFNKCVDGCPNPCCSFVVAFVELLIACCPYLYRELMEGSDGAVDVTVASVDFVGARCWV